ncbi:MAG: BCCT family transporter, partial [Sporomusa sp.]
MNNTEIKIDKLLFWPPLLLVAAMCGAIIINPEAGTGAANNILSFLTGQMGWVYEVFILGNLGVVAYFIFGKLADKRFGGEKPEFSTLSWLGMLFSAGTSAAILYWSPIEFYFYLTAPPFGLEAMSPNATAMASAYPLFHWGISSYALYVGVGVVFGYLFFVQGKEVVRPSTACEFLLGKHASGYLGKI